MSGFGYFIRAVAFPAAARLPQLRDRRVARNAGGGLEPLYCRLNFTVIQIDTYTPVAPILALRPRAYRQQQKELVVGLGFRYNPSARILIGYHQWRSVAYDKGVFT